MSDNTNFFKEEPVEQIEETFKLGEKEYSQEELQRLVGLGELATEIETKQNTKLDRVFPEYTKATQKLSEYEKRVQELEAKANQPIQPVQPIQSAELTAEQREIARKQIEDLGFGQNAFRQIVREELAAKELLGDIDGLLESAQADGKPSTTSQELLQHMAETGIKNPAKAYKDMFEDELDALKEKKLAEIKPQGMVTTNGSQAGSKQPTPVKITKANLQSLVHSALSGE